MTTFDAVSAKTVNWCEEIWIPVMAISLTNIVTWDKLCSLSSSENEGV
jgi:hypothetical protein